MYRYIWPVGPAVAQEEEQLSANRKVGGLIPKIPDHMWKYPQTLKPTLPPNMPIGGMNVYGCTRMIQYKCCMNVLCEWINETCHVKAP